MAGVIGNDVVWTECPKILGTVLSTPGKRSYVLKSKEFTSGPCVSKEECAMAILFARILGFVNKATARRLSKEASQLKFGPIEETPILKIRAKPIPVQEYSMGTGTRRLQQILN